MKTRSILISAICAALALSSCAGTDELDPSLYSAPTVRTVSPTVTGSTVEITISATASKSTFRECGFYYGTDQSLSDARKLTATTGETFSSTFIPDGFCQTYYWQAYLSDHGSEIRSEVSSVSSLSFSEYVKVSVPTVEVTPAGAVAVAATVETATGILLTDKGVCYSRDTDPTVTSPKESSGPGTGVIAVRIEDLTIGETYHIRCYARQGDDVSYSQDVTAVPSTMPAVTTSSVTDITATTASSGGKVTSDGGTEVTARGAVWSTKQNPTIDLDTKTSDGTGTGPFTSSLTGLQPGTTYYVRAYATNSTGTGYGEEEVFTTEATLPTVTTSDVKDITASGATCGGNVTSDGGAAVTDRGVVWSTEQSPTIDLQTKTSDGTGTGSFSSSLKNLTSGVKYYVRAYATNSKGTAYGQEMTITTRALPPTVTTSDVADISATTATCGGSITSDGGAAVTARGVVWSTSQNPTVSSNSGKTSDGTGTGSFTSALTGLQPGTKYYVRAYAINPAGTAYGEEKVFTTELGPPSVTTSDVTGISSTTATCGGSITSDGGAAVTAKGVVWSTSQNPTVSSNSGKTSDGTGTGSFTSELTELTKNTTYYVRAYATNQKGTSYGEQQSFTTSSRDAVDLGLSVRWASENIGADTYTDYGDYYAWGETSTKSDYSWSTYKWCNGSSTTMTKYCTSSDFGTVDNKTVLETSDDVAHVKWGGSWRMPTAEEWQELYDSCTWTWTTISGVNGYKVTSKKTGYTDRWIFLPAAGCRDDTYLYHVGSCGYYWSSSLYSSSYSSRAYCYYFDSGGMSPRGYDGRCGGQSVRPVCD